MSTKKLARLLSLPEKGLTTDALPVGHLPLPTLDERVSIYLRAVHGERDFTSKEYSEARSLLLDAMAADIAGKSEVGLSEQPPGDFARPGELPPSLEFRAFQGFAEEAVACRSDLASQPVAYSLRLSDAHEAGLAAQSVRPRAIDHHQYESNVVFFALDAEDVRPPARPKVRRHVFVWGGVSVAAAVAALAIVGLPKDRTSGDPNASGSPQVAVQSAPSEPSKGGESPAVQTEVASKLLSPDTVTELREAAETRVAVQSAPIFGPPRLQPGRQVTSLEAYQSGARALRAGETAKGVNALEYAAEQGHAAAQWKLGRMYAEGDGVERNDLRAFGYFSRVANAHAQDSPDGPQSRFVANAFVALGHYYLKGIPNSAVKANPGRAREMFSYAASYFGDPDAQYNLARMYLEGNGGPKDPRQAARWLEVAAKKGQHHAQAMLGHMLFKGGDVPRQRARGLMWLTLAREGAASGDTWIHELYDSASKQASPDERRVALRGLGEHRAKGGGSSPVTAHDAGNGAAPSIPSAETSPENAIDQVGPKFR